MLYTPVGALYSFSLSTSKMENLKMAVDGGDGDGVCVCVLLRNSKLELVDVERALSHDGWRGLRCIVCVCV